MATMQMQPAIAPVASTSDAATAGAWRVVQGFREGTISTATFYQRLSAAGMVRTGNIGTIVTPIASVSYVILRPEIALRCTSATTMTIPVSLKLSFTVSTGTVVQWWTETGTNDMGNGTSTAATLGPLNLRNDKTDVGDNVLRYRYTGDATAMTGKRELWRYAHELGTAAGAWVPGTVTYAPLLQEGVMPMIAGLGTWATYQVDTGTPDSYYAQVTWIETPLNWWN